MNQLLLVLLMGFIAPMELLMLLILILITLVPYILYLRSMKDALSAVHRARRKMQPNRVWLCLIPVYGLFWQFVVVSRLADSLKTEFEARTLPLRQQRPGFAIGLAACIGICLSLIPGVKMFTGLPTLICLIIHWTQIHNYKIQLQHNNSF